MSWSLFDVISSFASYSDDDKILPVAPCSHKVCIPFWGRLYVNQDLRFPEASDDNATNQENPFDN
jgi:hypothetical protein